MTQVWRASVARLAAVVAVLAVAGCAGGDDEAPQDAAGVVTVEHIYGSTAVAEVPERVVTIGGNAGDLPAALGVVPVGITSEGADFGADADGLQPWLREELEAAGADLPDAGLLDESWELQFERIAALEPDLILATRGWIDEDDYARLSSIAPTIGPLLEQGSGGDWREELRITGQVLGVEDRAEAVIAESEALIAGARSEHPTLDGATMLWSYEPADGQVSFLTGDYIGLDTFEMFGMSEDPSILSSGASTAEGDITAVISQENLSLLSCDFYFVIDMSMESLDQPLVARWAPVADGRYVQYDDLLLDSAVYSMSPLALRWLVEDSGFLAQVEEALDGRAVQRRAQG